MSEQRYLDDEENPGPDVRLEEAILGRDVERFLDDDPIGKYIAERARDESAEAQAELLTVDPTNARAIADLQFKGQLPLLIMGWLGAAIENGRAQAKLLQQEKDSAH